MPTVDELNARLDTLRQTPAYTNYLRARAHVLGMQEQAAAADGATARPSAYWREELSGFEYMLDASPLIVEKLRHHCYHVTGLKVYDYRSHKDDAQRKFEDKLQALIDVGGRGLLVSEPRMLGGFGFEIDGELYNVDTLKFYEVLIALNRGAVLGEFRESGERRIVWEIGAGWGGFPYQLKTLFPDVTYVISDLPELFLFSATYLMTAFPDATFAFAADGTAEGESIDWQATDFVFVPHTATDRVRPPRLDLTINMVSFQEMTTEQVRGYVTHAYEQGSRYLYSLNRDRSHYNPELTNVRELIAERFWPHEIEVLPVSYVKMLDKMPGAAARNPRIKAARGKLKAMKADAKRNLDYKHVIGWRRVDA